MAPRTRAPKPDEPQPAPRHAKADGPICTECWPAGWPETGATAGCVHGTWQR